MNILSSLTDNVIITTLVITWIRKKITAILQLSKRDTGTDMEEISTSDEVKNIMSRAGSCTREKRPQTSLQTS